MFISKCEQIKGNIVLNNIDDYLKKSYFTNK